ncbi:cell wall hydrolase [Qipengyuania sp. 6B39]|uniref:cell wall hydrolase n=1 Tax=Qipengyuania proteolytica TaxID=2867239 RepID=UPI001C89040D|nr:cell wall hydrolase [Qipengyuania proteolytica]MBX7496473.1 cell wall hydrolase [Qipengyuania proteolytica]
MADSDGRRQARSARAAMPRAARRAELKRSRRQLAARLGVLGLAIAVPTYAAQSELGEGLRSAMGLEDERVALTPMPFETAGESFPGSAFYFLEDAPRLATDLSELRQEEGTLETVAFAESHGAGAAAQAFRQSGGGLDKARALQCLSMAVYYEAASESYEGQQAVAQVVLNRVAHPAYPASVCGVVFQGSERKTGCQFSFTCDGSMRRTPSRASWARAQSVALGALAGSVYRPIGLATHYHTNYVNPYWAASLDYIRTIGAHRFYRWKGRAGQAGAFTDGYAGIEPGAAARAQSVADTTGSPAPLAVPPPNSALGVDNKPDTPVGAPAAASPPAKTDNLPQSGRVRDEYANSGRWIRDPGKKD